MLDPCFSWNDHFDFIANKTCTHSVLGPFGVYLLTFTLLGTLMHYLGSLKFLVICDASHITTHTRPT